MSRVYMGPGRKWGKPRRWFIDYTDVSGRRIRQATDAQTKGEALALLRSKLSENTKAEILGLQNTEGVKPVTFEAFFREQYLPYIGTRVRPSTYTRKVQLGAHLLRELGSLNLRAISAGHVERFMETRGKADPKPSPAEVNRERSLLSAVMNTAFRRGLVDINEVSRVRPLREENAKDLWLTREEVDAILDKAEAWLRPIIVLAINTGMREAEIVDLTWADLEHSPGWIRVGHSSKSGKVRFIPVNSTARTAIDGQTRHIGAEGRIPWVFLNPETLRAEVGSDGKQVPKAFSRFSVCHGFKRAALAAAEKLRKEGKTQPADRIAAATFHTTRHTFASWSIQAGIPIAQVQQDLGHSTDTMTRRYAHLAPAAKERRNRLEILVEDGRIPATNLAEKGRAL